MIQSLTQFTINKRNQLVRLKVDWLYSFFKSELVQLNFCGHTLNYLFLIILEKTEKNYNRPD